MFETFQQKVYKKVKYILLNLIIVFALYNFFLKICKMQFDRKPN